MHRVSLRKLQQNSRRLCLVPQDSLTTALIAEEEEIKVDADDSFETYFCEL